MTSAVGQILASGLCLLAISGAAGAADLTAPTPRSAVVSEVRGGLLYHDLLGKEPGVDLNAEFLSRWGGFGFVVPGLDTFAMLRPHIGASLNLMGDTSMIYAGYTLTVDVTDRLFVEGSFGGMVHNGYHDTTKRDRLELGCSLLFRESAAVGLRLTERLNVTATIEHSSNNGECAPNNGLTNAGVRLGYAF
ncbi:acyloxyacyl hydrolase [Polymorphum gilvum]|uniref:acyloxyacyl hydrolase n=1 Tax=Polymorphum gilvum TaxID=991904 RepID=UPI0013052773|nr:acyloxyacyl hydrolase [Polymorphum gilvum]